MTGITAKIYSLRKVGYVSFSLAVFSFIALFMSEGDPVSITIYLVGGGSTFIFTFFIFKRIRNLKEDKSVLNSFVFFSGIIALLFTVTVLIACLIMTSYIMEEEGGIYILLFIISYFGITTYFNGMMLWYFRKLPKEKSGDSMDSDNKNNEMQNQTALPITLKVKLELKEFVRICFIVAYRNPMLLWITIIGVGMISMVINYMITSPVETKTFPVTQTLFGLFSLIGIPVSIFFNAKKNMRKNKWVNQIIEYRFDKKIYITGETFQLSMEWTDLKSIQELKEWFVLFTAKQQGYFIPKNRFINSGDEKEFKILISEIKNVKLKLL